MEQKEKLMKLEEVMDLDENVLEPETVLSEVEDWDSIAHLSLIILLDEEYGRKISGKEIRALKTVQDILNLMQ